MRRYTKLTLEQLVELEERKTARMMGWSLKQYREQRDKLMELIFQDEKVQGHRRVKRRN